MFCHIYLLLFNKKSNSIDGLRPDCKDCRKSETIKYRLENKEKIKFNNNKYYLLNKNKNKEYHKKWRSNNKEKLREYSKLLYKKNSYFFMMIENYLRRLP